MSSVSLMLSLPQEVLYQTFTHLDPEEIMSMASTCSKMYDLCRDKILWQQLLELNKDNFIPSLKEIPKVESALEFYKNSIFTFKYSSNIAGTVPLPTYLGELKDHTILCHDQSMCIDVKKYLNEKIKKDLRIHHSILFFPKVKIFAPQEKWPTVVSDISDEKKIMSLSCYEKHHLVYSLGRDTLLIGGRSEVPEDYQLV